MAGFQVDITEADEPQAIPAASAPETKGRRIFLRLLAAAVVLAVTFFAVASVSSLLYWRSLSQSPQYTLALVVDAARNGDDRKVNEYVDVDAVVEDFVPQITAKAVEMYGRGLSPEVIKKAEVVAAPLVPVIKQRARSELPRLLRKKTERYKDVPFWALAFGAGRYLDVKTEGDEATVRGRSGERELELRMKREDGRWKIVAVKDDTLAEEVASKIGQELIFLARQAGRGRIEDLGRSLGLDGIGDLLKKAEDIFK